MLRSIEVVAFILDNYFICKDNKAVCKSSWDEELPTVIFCEFNCNMLIKGRGIVSYINGDIKYCSFTTHTNLLCA